MLLEVVHPRKLTALEWAMLRVVDTFGDSPPTLTETAEELGIADASFLADTLREVVRLRALEPRAAEASWKDLPDLAFTPTGHELFHRGQIEAEPAEHGEDLYFDALTDEALSEPLGMQDWADVPFPATGPEPQAREAVGLDRAREIVRRLHPELLRGDGEIRSVQPRADSWPCVVWAPREVELRLSDRGEVWTTGPTLTPMARKYLASVDPIDEGVLPTASVTGAWGDPAPRRSSALSFEAWRHLTSETLATGDVHREVLRLVGTARREVQLHAGWCADDALNSLLAERAKNGVRVLVVGAPETDMIAFHERPTLGFVLKCGSRDPLPAAVVVDGRAGVIAEGVELQYGELRRTVELAGVIKSGSCADVRARLVQAAVQATGLRRSDAAPRAPVLGHVDDVEAVVNQAFEDLTLRLAVARLSFLGATEGLAPCVRRVSDLAPGPERVRILTRLGDLALALADPPSEATARGPAAGAWRALVLQLKAGREDVAAIGMLASLAPPGVEAEELVRAAIAGCLPSIDARLPDATRFLVHLGRVVDSRWGRDVCRSVAAYREQRDDLLRRDRVPAADSATRLEAARRLLDARELRAWAADEIASLAEPRDAKSLERWSGEAAGFAEIAPDDAKREALSHFRRLTRGASVPVDLVRAASSILDAPALVDAMLPATPLLADVLEARRRLSTAGVPSDTGLWRSHVEQALPNPTSLPSTATATELVASLFELGGEVPALAPIGRSWAARAAMSVPVPETPAGLTWWLSELLPLRPLLDDLRTLAATTIRRFQGPLRTARARNDPLWDDVMRAWLELGLPGSTLEGIVTVEERRSGGSGAGPKDRKKKGRKGR